MVSSYNFLYSQFKDFLTIEKNTVYSTFYTSYDNQNSFPKSLYDEISLWLLADKLQADDNSYIDRWQDISSNGLIANQINSSRMPAFIRQGINGKASVRFNGLDKFGFEDILTIDYNPALTTKSEFADNSKKTLSVVFYCEDLSRKQVIFEAGGSTSGFIIYLDSPEYIYFGFFRQSSRVFVKHKIAPGLHLAQLEYDGEKFRGILDGVASDYKNFSGIISDISLTGIGGASTGTRFADFSTGVTCGYHFSGLISEIILLNDCNSASSSKIIYDYLDKKYNIYGSYPFNWSKSIEQNENEISDYERQMLKIININHEISLNFMIPIDDNCKIEIFDINGKLIEEIYNGDLKANFEYNFSLNSTLYKSGTFLVRLKGNKMITTEIFILI